MDLTITRRNCLISGLLLGLLSCVAMHSRGDDVLLDDDFSGPELDSAVWSEGDWWISARSKLGAEPVMGTEGGVTFVSLPMDTYHPTYPGSFFLASEIYTKSVFPRGNGLKLEARLRALDAPSGAVCSFFTFARIGDWPGVKDEIDIEILTARDVNTLFCTSWNDWEEEVTSSYGDGMHHLDAVLALPSYDYRVWNDYKILWLTNRIEWYVNETLVNTFYSPLPDLEAPVRFNFWASGPEWADAYDGNLQPTADPAQNVTYYYDIDQVRVTALHIAAPESPNASVSAPYVTLSWVDSADNETGFQVFRSIKPKGGASAIFEAVGTVGPDVETYLDMPGKGKYLYKIQAYNQETASADSPVIPVSVRGKPGR